VPDRDASKHGISTGTPSTPDILPIDKVQTKDAKIMRHGKRPASQNPKGDPMKIIDHMKAFELGDKVTANMTAQGMTEGEEYTVAEVLKFDLASGVYFNYVLEDAEGEWLHIRNGHILLDIKR
jgi:hypothetical protein